MANFAVAVESCVVM